jgi:hypothetical protein
VASSSSSHGPSPSSHLRAQQLLEKALDCIPAAALAAAGGLGAMIYRLDYGQAELKAELKASQQVLGQQLQCLATVVEEQNQGIKALIDEWDKVFQAKMDLLEAKMDLLEEKMVSKLSNIEHLIQLKGHR